MRRVTFGRMIAVITLAAAAVLASGTVARADPAGLTRIFTDPFTNSTSQHATAVEPDTTLKVMRTEVARLKTEPIPTKRFAETVNGFLTRYFLRQEANMDQAATLGAYELVGGGWRRADTFIGRVRAVAPADVQRVARKYLRDLRFAVVGDSTKIDRALFTSM